MSQIDDLSNKALTAVSVTACRNEDSWAEQIVNQAPLKESKSKLERRISAFLVQADPAERIAFENERAKLIDVFKTVEEEQMKEDAATTATISSVPRRQMLRAKIKAGCTTVSKVTYEYSQIMDLLASRAPEYVALAWGAIKIVLVAHINYEEMKEKIVENLQQIKVKFEMIDHLTSYKPMSNIVLAVAKAYELFTQFLAKAVKYYSMSRFRKTWKALAKPWKVDLQGLVDGINLAFIDIKEISQLHGLLDGHLSLTVGQKTLQHVQIGTTMQERSLDKLESMENMLQRIHDATIVRFSKEQDVQQSAVLLRQCVDEKLSDPETSSKDDLDGTGTTAISNSACTGLDPGDLDSLRDKLFPDLRDFHLNRSREEEAIQHNQDTGRKRSRKRNLAKIDKVIDWIESDSSQLLWIDGNNVLQRADFCLSFAAPLLILGESNYESVLILRYACGNTYSGARGYRILVQSLLFQILEQRPQTLARKKDCIEPERMKTDAGLWNVFLECLRDTDAHCTFIVIENVNATGYGANEEADTENRLLIQQLSTLVQDQTQLIKVLLTADIAKSHGDLPENSAVLVHSAQNASLTSVQEESTSVPHKLIEIQQKNCKDISWAELMLLYIHNTTIFSLDDEDLRCFVVTELSGMERRSFESYNPLQLRAWSVNHDGRRIARRFHDLVIPQFSGRRAISSLRYVPSGYLNNESDQRKNLVARGKLWWKYSSDVHQVLAGRNKSLGVIDQTICKRAPAYPQEFQDGLAKSSKFQPKPLYHLLCPPLVEVFLLRELSWAPFKVMEVCCYSHKKNEALETLVLPDGHLDKLRALVDAQPIDSYRAKGTGLIILFYGSSGVGKSYSVECLAEYTGRPLLQVMCGSLGDTPEAIEKKFGDYIQLARKWDCLLQVKEVGIFLYTRSGEELRYDLISTTFLRLLDSCTGTVFLTTNRFNKLDLNILSRLHLSLFFPRLNYTIAKEIWKTHLDQVQTTLGVIGFSNDSKEDVLNFVCPDPTEYQAGLGPKNGYQIRNVIQAAVSLAQNDGKLMRRHFEEISQP